MRAERRDYGRESGGGPYLDDHLRPPVGYISIGSPRIPFMSMPPASDSVDLREKGVVVSIGSVHIHKLPLEILSLILLFLPDPDQNSWNHYVRLGRLSRICKQWKHVIESSPQLWSTLNVLFPRTVNKRILSFSGSVPLSIIVQFPPHEPASGHIFSPRELFSSAQLDPTALLTLALPHITRWRRLQLLVGGPTQVSLLDDHAPPALEELDLNFTDGDSAAIATPFKGGAPKLKSLSLKGFIFDWLSPLFRGLTVLRLDPPQLSFVPLHQLTNILANNPDLRILTLEGGPFHDAGLELSPDASTVAQTSLPHLSLLSLKGLRASLLYALLPYIDAPALWHLIVWYTTGAELLGIQPPLEPHDHRASFVQWLNLFVAPSHTYELHIKIAKKKTCLINVHPTETLPSGRIIEVAMGGDGVPLEWLEWVYRNDALPAPNTTSIHMFEPNHNTYEALELPNVQTLKISVKDARWRTPTRLAGVLDELAGGSGDANFGNPPSYPQLETLIIENQPGQAQLSVHSDTVVGMVMRRYDADRPSIPERLKLLRLINVWPALSSEQLERMEQTLGTGIVQLN